MNKHELRDAIDSLVDDINFVYMGVEGTINPFSRTDISIAFGDESYDFANVNDALNAPILNGKSLGEVAELIEFYYA